MGLSLPPNPKVLPVLMVLRKKDTGPDPSLIPALGKAHHLPESQLAHQ